MNLARGLDARGHRLRAALAAVRKPSELRRAVGRFDVLAAVDGLRQAPGEEDTAMPTLISLSPDGAGRFIAVDDEGQIRRGQLKRERSDGEYIDRKSVRSEFQER
jgi:hypothetical protein